MTEVHIVELAAFIQTKHESDVLRRSVAACMQPVATAYGDVPEAPLDGYIVHCVILILEYPLYIMPRFRFIRFILASSSAI